jgi:aminoglycoside phosphotransferase family enzyme/predicted kinase
MQQHSARLTDLPSNSLQRHDALMACLMQDNAAFPEPIAGVERIDTHISTVLLAGQYAYKFRKPVKFGFLDFSTLELRHRDCLEELRLNQRTAPAIYRDVVAVVGDLDAPRIVDGPPTDEALEFAVRMRRFDPAMTFDRLAERNELAIALMDRLASKVAALHRDAAPAPAGMGTPEMVLRWCDENFVEMRELVHSAADRERLDTLARWADDEWKKRSALMATRAASGCIRECHGDLHLGNVVLFDGAPTLFDAVEFNAELRCIDVINEVAFMFMDLADHRLDAHAWRFMGAYLEITGDYDGLALLHWYAVYRALVRAKIALIRLHQAHVPQHVRLREHTSAEDYLQLAERLRRPGARVLAVMTGLSGSGKSTVAQCLASALGGVRIRSDVERKRLHGMAPRDASGGRIYSEAENVRTYERLATLAAEALDARVPAVIDAACLKLAERRRFRALAAARDATVVLVACEAPDDTLRSRLRERAAAATDASEATVQVMDSQLRWQEPLDDDDQAIATVIDTSVEWPLVGRRCNELATELRARADANSR